MRLLPLVAAALLVPSCSSGGPAARPSSSRAPSPTPSGAAPLPEPVDPLSPRPAIESAAPLGGPPCRGEDLSVADADLVTAGGRLQEVFAVRTGGPACSLRGWPGATLRGQDGRVLPVAARRTGTASAVTLSRATSLSFVLATPRSASCADVATVDVVLPGTNRVIRVATTMQVCDGSLLVGPVERRQDAEGAEH